MSDRSEKQTHQLVLHPSVARLAIEMQRKLDRDRHKPGWAESAVPLAYFVARLLEELREMQAADMDDVWAEAADVANFAMMYADRKTRDDRAT
jgi:hypothetical protein